jgi:hypothetical protein
MSEELCERSRRAVQLVHPDGSREEGARAVLTVLGYLGWPAAGVLRRRPWIWAAVLGYRLVASSRGIWSRFLFLDPDQCRKRQDV